MKELLSWVRQRPVLSGIIAIVGSTIIGNLIVFTSQNVSLMAMMLFVWVIVVGGSAILFVFSVIMLLCKAKDRESWKRLLLNTLWILLVGGGSCGTLMFLFFMENWFF